MNLNAIFRKAIRKVWLKYELICASNVKGYLLFESHWKIITSLIVSTNDVDTLNANKLYKSPSQNV